MRKKSPEKSLEQLQQSIADIQEFLTAASDGDIAHLARCFDHAVIWAYRSFEKFVLDVLVAEINLDPAPLYEAVGVSFGANPTAAQCEYLLVGDGYFDFRGHGEFVKLVKKAAGKGSSLEGVVKKEANRKCFEILSGLRNYAAHESDQAKASALKAMRHWEPNRQNLGSAGNWLRVQMQGTSRIERLLTAIGVFCEEMKEAVD